MLFKNVSIESVAYELPPHAITSASLEDEVGATLDRAGIPRGRLESLSGIRERRFWDQGVMPSEVATLAARKAIDKSGIDPGEIGLLINSSVCRDYIEPSTAALVHGNLKLPATCMSYDLGNACLGFLNAMCIIGQAIEAGTIKYGLVVDGESSREPIEATLERLKKPTATKQDVFDNFATLTLGSGAVAMVLGHKDFSRTSHRLNGAVTHAATQHNRLCIGTPTSMKTDAAALLVAGVELAGKTWKIASQTLPDWSDASVDLYAPHQVGDRHIMALAMALGLTPEKMHLNFQTMGNVGPAAVPITLAMAEDAGRAKTGTRAGLLGIGSGINVSMMSVTW